MKFSNIITKSNSYTSSGPILNHILDNVFIYNGIHVYMYIYIYVSGLNSNPFLSDNTVRRISLIM